MKEENEKGENAKAALRPAVSMPTENLELHPLAGERYPLFDLCLKSGRGAVCSTERVFHLLFSCGEPTRIKRGALFSGDRSISVSAHLICAPAISYQPLSRLASCRRMRHFCEERQRRKQKEEGREDGMIGGSEE